MTMRTVETQTVMTYTGIRLNVWHPKFVKITELIDEFEIRSFSKTLPRATSTISLRSTASQSQTTWKNGRFSPLGVREHG